MQQFFIWHLSNHFTLNRFLQRLINLQYVVHMQEFRISLTGKLSAAEFLDIMFITIAALLVPRLNQ